MSDNNQHSDRLLKHLLYDLRVADEPDFFYITQIDAIQLNNVFNALGYEYRFFPISLISGGESERSN